jgi:hypothetical protein
MKRPIVRIKTGAEIDQFIDREMTDQEFAQYEVDKAAEAIKQSEAEAKAQAKVAAEGKLAALGLTTDDLRALGL